MLSLCELRRAARAIQESLMHSRLRRVSRLDEHTLVLSLEAREELCSTGIPGGLALLHSRNPESYLFETAFLALGRTIQQIPFGAPDGQPTNLFFLIGCPDDRMHLHALARLCMMAQKTDLLAELREAVDTDSMCECILTAEQAVLATRQRATPRAVGGVWG